MAGGGFEHLRAPPITADGRFAARLAGLDTAISQLERRYMGLDEAFDASEQITSSTTLALGSPSINVQVNVPEVGMLVAIHAEADCWDTGALLGSGFGHRLALESNWWSGTLDFLNSRAASVIPGTAAWRRQVISTDSNGPSTSPWPKGNWYMIRAPDQYGTITMKHAIATGSSGSRKFKNRRLSVIVL